MKKYGIKILYALLTAALIGGCHTPRMTADPQLPYPSTHEPLPGDVFHLATGTFLSLDKLVDLLVSERIVYIGESHDNVVAHRVEAEIVRALVRRNPGKVALGMEMFIPEQQDALDRWVAGEFDEKTFLKESRWYDHWKMDFDFYRSLLVTAKEEGIPVIGLNASKDLVRLVGQKPVEELDAATRDRLPEMDTSDPYHTALADAIFGGHDRSSKPIEAFRRIQTLWDETMAESVARYLASPGNEEMHMVVVAGGNHIRNGFGIPRRVFRRFPSTYAMVGLKEVIPEGEEDPSRLMDVRIPAFPMLPYDYYLYIEFERLQKQGIRLGVLLEDRGGEVTIKQLLPDSIALAAGARPGDVIRSIDEEPVQDSVDLKYALRKKTPGEKATLIVERGGETMSLELLFGSP